MLRIDIFEALLNKTADVSLKIVVPLEFFNLKDNETLFECSKRSKVFDLPPTILEDEKFFL